MGCGSVRSTSTGGVAGDSIPTSRTGPGSSRPGPCTILSGPPRGNRIRAIGWRTRRPPAGRLYLDPAGTWDALSLGWSVNEHHELRMSCRPWVELLASIGLQAFPVTGHRATGGFHYNLWRPAPLPAAVAAFGGPWSRAYALGRYHVPTGKTGSNTMLRQATPTKNADSPLTPG